MIDLMGAIMADVLSGAISPGTCNAACNAGGKLLKTVEMEQKYGVSTPDGNQKMIPLCGSRRRSVVADRIGRMEQELHALRSEEAATV